MLGCCKNCGTKFVFIDFLKILFFQISTIPCIFLAPKTSSRLHGQVPLFHNDKTASKDFHGEVEEDMVKCWWYSVCVRNAIIKKGGAFPT